MPNAKPLVPPSGGYEFEVIELGPPVYAYPPPEPKHRGKLVGAGDGEGSPYRPPPGRMRAAIVLGGEGRDTLLGGCGDDLLDGGAGQDRAFGEDGQDFVMGGGGNDVVRGSRGDDTLVVRSQPMYLVPTPDEVATLPKLAREAFAARCVARVPGAVTAAGVANRLVERATNGRTLTRQLGCLRRDFERLRHLAREGNWTDDTPVVPEVLGRLWPPGVAPAWAE